MSSRQNYARRRPQGKVYDSHCGDIRVRGSAQQVREKYLTLSSEAGDTVIAEAFKQQAEHYTRIIMENNNGITA